MAIAVAVGNNGSMRRAADLLERAVQRAESLARTGWDTARYAEELTDALGPLVPHAAACVVTLDPATSLLTGTYKFGGLAGQHHLDGEWAQIEYGSDDPTRMVEVAAREVPAVATSQLPGGPQDSIRVRNLVGPAGYGDELRMAAREDGQTWGGVNLFRGTDDPAFDAEEVEVLSAVSASVATGLRASLIARGATAPGADGAAGSGPAVLVVDGEGAPRQVSVGTHDLLGELTEEANRSPAEGVVQGLVAAARRFAEGRADTLPRTRVRLPSGRWLVVQAAPLAGEGRSDDGVVVTVDDARPPEIVPLLAAAFGLSDREREVTQLVLTGADTKGIAAELHMSAYTVQDHLKSIFDKVDVRSRRELVARVFFDQYAPRLSGDVGPSGWFRGDGSAPSVPSARPGGDPPATSS